MGMHEHHITSWGGVLSRPYSNQTIRTTHRISQWLSVIVRTDMPTVSQHRVQVYSVAWSRPVLALVSVASLEPSMSARVALALVALSTTPQVSRHPSMHLALVTVVT